MALQPGTTLGHYEILAAIGKGGMGEVWRQKLKREVAIKVLPDPTRTDQTEDAGATEAREPRLSSASSCGQIP